jgi:recombinational DNA repair protein (RecF pathway)
MGGERGSTARQRIEGRICCACKNPLPVDLTHQYGERYCERCRPPFKVVNVSFERKVSWHLVFYDSATQQRLCSLAFQDDDKIVELAKRGGALTNLEAKQAIEKGISNGKVEYF